MSRLEPPSRHRVPSARLPGVVSSDLHTRRKHASAPGNRAGEIFRRRRYVPRHSLKDSLIYCNNALESRADPKDSRQKALIECNETFFPVFLASFFAVV